jgi:hypothetical protein
MGPPSLAALLFLKGLGVAGISSPKESATKPNRDKREALADFRRRNLLPPTFTWHLPEILASLVAFLVA